METTSDWTLTKCPTCGCEGLAEGEREVSRTFDGRTFTRKVPARVCPEGREEPTAIAVDPPHPPMRVRVRYQLNARLTSIAKRPSWPSLRSRHAPLSVPAPAG